MNILNIPGYAEAVEKETFIRQAAFHDIIEDIGPFKARPLTLLDYNGLRLAESPLLPPFRPTSHAELVAFLWFMAPGPKTKIKHWAFKIVCRRMNNEEAHNKILGLAREYMCEALMDRPRGVETSGHAPSYFTDICAAVCGVAREFGGGPMRYLSMPLKVIFQCFNEIRTYHSDPATLVLFNPLSSKVLNDYLVLINRKN